MNTTTKTLISRNKNIILIVLGTMLILSIPLIAMQFSDEVKWDLEDFIVIGALLIGTGLIYEVIARRIEKATHRRVLALVFIAAVLVIWVELAVGIFD